MPMAQRLLQFVETDFCLREKSLFMQLYPQEQVRQSTRDKKETIVVFITSPNFLRSSYFYLVKTTSLKYSSSPNGLTQVVRRSRLFVFSKSSSSCSSINSHKEIIVLRRLFSISKIIVTDVYFPSQK